jgi:hypothetical protein
MENNHHAVDTLGEDGEVAIPRQMATTNQQGRPPRTKSRTEVGRRDASGSCGPRYRDSTTVEEVKISNPDMTGSLVPHSVIDAVEDGVREQVEVDDRRVMGPVPVPIQVRSVQVQSRHQGDPV